jgi:hypothetical protein
LYASAPYGSGFSVAFLAVLGARTPARTNVTLVFSFGMYSLNLDPAETKSTMAWCRPARFHEGRYCDARLALSEASTILGMETSLVECMPLPSAAALHVSSRSVGGSASLRLFSNDELIQFGGTVFVITLVSQNGSQSLFNHLLGNVAEC